MVSSGTVTSDLSSLSSHFSTYSSTMSGLDGSWKGASADSIQAKASEFASSFLSTMQSEMEAFATACDLYKEYEIVKSSLKSAESSYNSAKSSNDSNAVSRYSSEISSLKSKMESLKKKIEAQLATASSGKLEATSITPSTESSSGSTTTTESAEEGAKKAFGGKDFSKDSNFVYYNQGGGWKNYRYSNGGSNTMGKSGCGPTSMAMVLSSLGYNINPNVAADWSADHNYHYDGTSEKYFTAYAKELGVNSRALGKSSKNIAEALSNNELVILHVGPGSLKFTGNGHYMVARAYDANTNKVLIADPNKKTNNRWFNLDEVVRQLKGSECSWAFSAGTGNNNDSVKV